jgi:hypothetical protein
VISLAGLKYFVYSRAHHKEQLKIVGKKNRKYNPGKVYVAGAYKPYTEIVENIGTCRFSDTEVVLSTDSLSSVSYTEPTFGTR